MNPFHPGFGNPGRFGKGSGGEDLLGRVTLTYPPTLDFDAILKASARAGSASHVDPA